ncbi:hypothetical protein DFA_11209 [Cavenderia fasciculata]|uniref:Uncharacterized protein n=1 Tax=Cavenderia fasciculata TaxID=261658 RepID=F4QFE1_CACFS|nr:uncharacterized protein DFA_11209 [Cavenderia fasciculata]EGG13448.1 hypothetical protein DFA_11209 [Cavenderia fasciculata]|eukprot:XP_004350152.1 hypothetical protein DFA_11209 [Cavenderia fasciculata]
MNTNNIKDDEIVNYKKKKIIDSYNKDDDNNEKSYLVIKNIQDQATSTTTTNLIQSEEKKKKKKKKKNKKIQKETLATDDEPEQKINYGNVVDVKVDTSKPWTEDTVGQFLSDAGFVRGSGNTPRNKADITPIYIKFASKLLSMLSKDGGKLLCLELTGNGMNDLDNAFNLIGSRAVLQPSLPPSFYKMASYLVVAAYIQSTYHQYYGLADQQLKVVWDKTNLIQYLQTNTIRQYSTTKHPATPSNLKRINKIATLITLFIIKNSNIIPTHNPYDKTLTVDSAIDYMGRMAIQEWKTQAMWTRYMKRLVLSVTIIAFETGVQEFVYPPLIDGCLKQEILNNLEFPHFNLDAYNIDFVNKVDQVPINDNDQQSSSSTTSTSSTSTSTTKVSNIIFNLPKENRIRNVNIPVIQPGEIFEGINDEHNFKYNYGNVVDVEGVDTSKPWDEAILGQYLKHAGFVRGSCNTSSNKADEPLLFVAFSNKLAIQPDPDKYLKL